jgi:hypothetical protein
MSSGDAATSDGALLGLNLALTIIHSRRRSPSQKA